MTATVVPMAGRKRMLRPLILIAPHSRLPNRFVVTAAGPGWGRDRMWICHGIGAARRKAAEIGWQAGRSCEIRDETGGAA